MAAGGQSIDGSKTDKHAHQSRRWQRLGFAQSLYDGFLRGHAQCYYCWLLNASSDIVFEDGDPHPEIAKSACTQDKPRRTCDTEYSVAETGRTNPKSAWVQNCTISVEAADSDAALSTERTALAVRHANHRGSSMM